MKKKTKLLGNSNLIYTIIRKRQVFHQLSNLNTDLTSITENLKKAKLKNNIVEKTLHTASSSPELTSSEKLAQSSKPNSIYI